MANELTVTDLSAFGGDKRTVGVGYKFDSFDNGTVVIEPGDIVVWADPDSGAHAGQCELIHESTYVGRVTGVYAVEYSWFDSDEYSVELDTTLPIGRIDAVSPYVGIRGENYSSSIQQFGDRGTQSLVDSFLSSDYDDYMSWEYHLGEDGVPEDLWAAYEDNRYSGPGCPYCRGEYDNPRIDGE